MVRGDALSFVAADLTNDAGWAEALDRCDYVLHVASPIPHGAPENEDDVIIPARDGTLRVKRAARDARVKLTVLASAFGAVGFGYGRTDHIFTEDDWTILDGPGVGVYDKSKTLAERAAWDFIAAEGSLMELSVMNPVAVLGPVLGKPLSGGNEIMRRLLAGEMPGFIDLWFPIVDVQDVAVAHVRAMTTDGAAAQRFIIASESGMIMEEIGLLLKARLGEKARRVPAASIPSDVVRLAANSNPTMRDLAPQLGITKNISDEKARRILDLKTRPAEEAVLSAAESMLRSGIV
jgi:nucleoside-diphosphate-sugar epimerase